MVTSLTVLNYVTHVCRSPAFVIVLPGEFALQLMGDSSGHCLPLVGCLTADVLLGQAEGWFLRQCQW